MRITGHPVTGKSFIATTLCFIAWKPWKPWCSGVTSLYFFLPYLVIQESEQGSVDPPGGDSHMKVTGMLVVSLRVVNCRFWYGLGFLGRKPIFLPIQVLLRVCVKKYLYEKTKLRQSLASIFSAFKITEALIWLSVLAWSRLGVK